MELTFYGGINEIGGNKILLKENNATIFLDFGKSYKREDVYFEFPLLQPTNIGDLLKTGMIPEIEGLYRYYNFEGEYNHNGHQFEHCTHAFHRKEGLHQLGSGFCTLGIGDD